MQTQTILSLDQINLYYKVIKPIAQGSFGKVYLCYQEQLNHQFAVKVIDKNIVKKQKIQLLRTQAKLLQKINHPNIIKMKGMRQTNNYIYLQMQYAKCGTLGQLIKKRRINDHRLSIQQISVVMGSIFKGVSHLHSLNIIHRDLKPQNILACEQDDFTTLKIADFGLSIKVDFYSPKPSQNCGTLLFMAPQVIKKHPYTKSVDIWSCAIILSMLFNNGKHPLVSMKQKIAAQKYLEEIVKPWPKLQDQLAQDFLQKISKIQAIQRYTAAQALKHPFLTRNRSDPIPLTYNQSFKSFEVNQKISQMIMITVTLSKFFQISDKITMDKTYLEKVNFYNQQSLYKKNKINKSKNNQKNKFNSSKDVRQFFSQFQNKYNSIQSDSPKRIDSELQNKKSTNILNFNFINNNLDQCIKIVDLKQQSSTLQYKSLKIPISQKKAVNNKFKQIILSNSFSPNKKKHSIINLPKIQNNKQKSMNMKLSESKNDIIKKDSKLQINQKEINLYSPTKKLIKSRKNKRFLNEQGIKIYIKK